MTALNPFGARSASRRGSADTSSSPSSADEPSWGQELPTWPFAAFFAGYPLLWVLGLGGFAADLAALPMFGILLLRRGLRVPPGFGLWLLFLIWMTFAGTQLDSAGRMIGFVFRFMNYAAATVFFLYVYNSSRRALPLSRAIGLMALFWVWVVAGGYLGVVLPNGSISTPMQSLLPGSIAGNDYVKDLVHPKFAEVQRPWGAPRAYNRPSAPFPYTNTWGSHFALLVPFAILYMRTAAVRWRRQAVTVLLLASLVPAFSTLNRGMFLAVGVGVLYAALRFGFRGQVKWLAAVLVLLGIGLATASALGVGQSIGSRTQYSSTNAGRATIYREAFERTLQSPFIGYGAPRPSLTLSISVGTQGQFWNVMFSFGFVALILFCAWLWSLPLRTRAAPGALLWLHVVTVMASFMMFYYGLDGSQLVVIFVASALVMRETAAGPEAAPLTPPRRRPGTGLARPDVLSGWSRYTPGPTWSQGEDDD
ncbi:O-antigen ligase family protein [Actinoallomurus sp. NPDC052308]|uniref:O-antigen ligase family protein n=1 Tax=Actinoallomurus sp. NPDC052308 TaxID=3155530 RepID=UPI003437B1F0